MPIKGLTWVCKAEVLNYILIKQSSLLNLSKTQEKTAQILTRNTSSGQTKTSPVYF